jgi:hypothetical protein
MPQVFYVFIEARIPYQPRDMFAEIRMIQNLAELLECVKPVCNDYRD